MHGGVGLRAFRGHRPARHWRRRVRLLERGFRARSASAGAAISSLSRTARQALSQRPARTLRFRPESLHFWPSAAARRRRRQRRRSPPPCQTPARPQPTAEIAAVEAAAARGRRAAPAPSETPIDFSGLQAINADLELATHAVLIQHMRIDSARLNARAQRRLSWPRHCTISALYGGSGRGRFEIDAREPDARLCRIWRSQASTRSAS